jgi:hypothetical protein
MASDQRKRGVVVLIQRAPTHRWSAMSLAERSTLSELVGPCLTSRFGGSSGVLSGGPCSVASGRRAHYFACYSVTGQMDRVLERRGRVGRLSPGLWRSCVMSVSSEPDPEGRQGSVGVAAVEPERGGEVDQPCPAQHANGQVAQAGHDLRGGPGSDLGGVSPKSTSRTQCSRFSNRCADCAYG